MGLDIYTWLAQRLHRVNPSKPQFIPWPRLHEQFGQNYARHDLDGIAVGSFEIIAVHKAVVFHVADDRFDGIAPF